MDEAKLKMNGRQKLLRAIEAAKDGSITIDLEGLGMTTLTVFKITTKPETQEIWVVASLPSKDVIVLTVEGGSDDLNYEIRPIN